MLSYFKSLSYKVKGPWGDSDNAGGKGGNNIFDVNFGKMFPYYGGMAGVALFIMLISLWFLSGFYVVQPDEEAVKLRFGKYVSTTLPGLHYHFPYPFESVAKASVTAIQRMEMGYRTNADRSNQGFEHESLLLTKDENIVDTNFEIQWKIKDIGDFLFNFRSSEVNATIRNAAESVVREIIGNQDIATLLEGNGRALLADELMSFLQKLFDSYGAGIHVVSIQVKKVDPPGAVIDAFRDVQSARADRERMINIAQAYANDIIPRARGEAHIIINNAEAYKESAIHMAAGESQRFKMVYARYKEARELTKEKLYLDTVYDIFADVNKIVVDKQNNSVYYLPLSDLLKSKGPTGGEGGRK